MGRAAAYNKFAESRKEVMDYLEAIKLIQKYDFKMTDGEWADLDLKVAQAYANLNDNKNAYDWAEKSYNLGNKDAALLMEKTNPKKK